MAGSAWGETRLALRGTLLLARGDPRGLGCFDASLGGFWRSFRAGLVCYPFYFLLLFSRVTPAQWNAAGGFRIVAIETITFVISWTAFPLIMLRVCRWFGRDDHFFGFMVIYNWWPGAAIRAVHGDRAERCRRPGFGRRHPNGGADRGRRGARL